MRKLAISLPMGSAFQAWGIASGKALRWDPAWPFWEIVNTSLWLEHGEGGGEW